MDEQEMDRIEQEQYMEDLRGYIAEQRNIIQQCTERTEEIQERLNEIQEDFEWEGYPQTDEVQDLYAELTSLDVQILDAKRNESFYVTQLFKEEIKELSPAEISRLYDELGNLKITHTLMDDTLALEEVQEKQHILEDHIHSSKELSALFVQRIKSTKQETSQDVMDWLEGRTDTVKKETSPLQQKNEYKKYSDWIKMIKQQCGVKNYVRTEFLEEPDSDSSVYDQYDHYVLDNGLHIYINDTAGYSGDICDSVVMIYEDERLHKSENGGKRSSQRSICFSEFAVDGLNEFSEEAPYSFQLDFTIGNVKASDNVPASIIYIDDGEVGLSFLPDKAGCAVSEQETYLEENFDLSEDINKKLENAIKHTDDTELQSTYQKALEFYTKVYDIVKSQIKDVETQSTKKESPLQQREAELSSLEAEEKTISETEKLIAQKENEGQTI